MAKITWDNSGERFYETGVNHGVLYKYVNGAYTGGVAWNGLTGVDESPDGAESNDLWADNIKYGSLRSTEIYGGTITAYMSPPEFDACDGSQNIATGVTIGQQEREMFGLCYRTEVGNDTPSTSDDAYKLHLVYGCMATPSERSYETINDSPDAIELSWDFDTTPVNVTGHKPTSLVIIDSRTANKAKLDALKDILYGTETNEPRMPLPDEIATLMATT